VINRLQLRSYANHHSHSCDSAYLAKCSPDALAFYKDLRRVAEGYRASRSIDGRSPGDSDSGKYFVQCDSPSPFLGASSCPGMIVDVDGRKMHIDCTGSGSPTIVLEAGGENDSLIWRGVQPAPSRTTRVCAYDRAGLGWSDVQPGPRDADHIAAELHQLLQQTGITGPVILMGHSIGGIFLRDYVTHYPTNVAGIVFIDSSTPFQDKNPAMKLAGSGPPLWIFNLAMIVGVPRLIGMCGGMQDVGDHEETAGGSDLPPALQRICRVGQLRPFQPADAAFRALRRTTDSHHLA
jgi:pimeloyl-ACP methyl ester carboxylesterase